MEEIQLMTRALPFLVSNENIRVEFKIQERNGMNCHNRTYSVNSVSVSIYSFACQRIINYSDYFNDEMKYARVENMGHCILAVSLTFILSKSENGFPLKSYGNGVYIKLVHKL